MMARPGIGCACIAAGERPCQAGRMPTDRPAPGWYVISLRPRGEHAGMRRAATAVGAGLVALSPWRLQPRDDEPTRACLREALGAPRVLFTSPAAVRAAARLQTLRTRDGQMWFAVGSGSAAALRRAGIASVHAPSRMHSEGLLALPELQRFEPDPAVGLVTAPGGRGVLQPQLQARGARVIRADVYARVPVTPGARALSRLRGLVAPAVVLVSSGAALQQVLATLPADVARQLRSMIAIAASQRLHGICREYGFARVAVAGSARPSAMLAAAQLAASANTPPSKAVR